MRSVVFLIVILAANLANAQHTVQLTAQMTDCGSKLNLYQFKAMDLLPLDQATLQDSVFRFTIETEGPRFVYIGNSPRNAVPVIVGAEPTLEISGSCRNRGQVNIANSEFNAQYIQLKNTMDRYRGQNNQLMRKMVRSQDSTEKAELKAELAQLDTERLQLLDSLKQNQPYFANILALNTYLSYANNQGEYNNELEYFGNEFFRFADFTQEGYNHLPWVYQAFMNYTNTLLSIQIPENLLQQFLNRSLSGVPSGSGTQQLALGGILTALDQKKSGLYEPYAKLFIEEHRTALPEIANKIEARMKMVTAFAMGKVAPDFTQQTPEGEDMKLSDLRGKYLLIDFWASWCGPCRRENPNVVRLYNKYKEQGFEILGVSLDRNRDRWLQAIEKDGLEWHHVSDLKGWQNAVAQQYNISSIPRTILLDPEGRIIGKNLRGASLQRKLEELFGGD